jgi:lipopolysaccharide export system protein LptA
MASDATYSSGSVQFTGSNMVTVKSSAGQRVVIDASQSVQTQNLHNVTLAGNSTSAGAGYIQISSGTMTLAGGNNITLSQDGNAVTISAGAGGGGVAISANAANGSTNFTSGTVTIAAGDYITLSSGNQAITIYGPSPSAANLAISAAGTSQNVGTMVWGNANNVSFGMAGSIITATATFAGGGGGATLSRWEIPNYGILTGTAVSSHAPASWWFNPFYLTAPLSFSNIWVIKSMSLSNFTASSVASSGVQSIAYKHGVTIFTRQDWGANSTNISYLTTGSFGLSLRRSATSVSQSLWASWVTNTAGGISEFSTTSNASNLLLFFMSNRRFAIPMVTSLSAGEYFIAHQHSTTTGTTNSNITLASFSNFHIAPQLATFKQPGISVAGQNASSAMPAGIGFGVASAVTTNNTMAASVISAGTQQYWYANFVNLS